MVLLLHNRSKHVQLKVGAQIKLRAHADSLHRIISLVNSMKASSSFLDIFAHIRQSVCVSQQFHPSCASHIDFASRIASVKFEVQASWKQEIVSFCSAGHASVKSFLTGKKNA